LITHAQVPRLRRGLEEMGVLGYSQPSLRDSFSFWVLLRHKLLRDWFVVTDSTPGLILPRTDSTQD
jgi:hypothetical protein